MLAKPYSIRRVVYALFWVDISLSVFTLPLNVLNFNPWHLPLVTAQASSQTYRNNIENAAHFVHQTLDHLHHHHNHHHHQSSSLFDAPDSDEGVVSLHEGYNDKADDQLEDSSEYNTIQPNDSYEEPIDGDNRNLHRNDAEQHFGRDRTTTWPTIRTLDDDSINHVCHKNRGADRIYLLSRIFLNHCSRYNMEGLSSRAIFDLIAHNDSLICKQTLEEFSQLDETIAQFDRLFSKLLMRYNCHNGYSVKWNCDDCKTAYKDWLCATHLPFYMRAVRIKPCISFCERVEQRCPYLHPITREQYGGQPVFICRDPNIPFVPEITPDIPYSDPGNCYDLCHLSKNLTELVIDSLSKYDYLKCPNESAIAGSVQDSCRSDQCEQLAAAAAATTKGGGPYLAEPNYTTSPDEVQSRSSQVAIQPHKKKLDELREVLANYKNQAKTHRYHAEHSSIDHHSKSPGGDSSHSSR